MTMALQKTKSFPNILDWFGMKIINQTTNEETNYYYIKNITGDVIKIIDEDGIECVEYLYNGYGEIIDIKGTLSSTIGQLNPIRYKGYYVDAATGFAFYHKNIYNVINLNDVNLIEMFDPMS